MTNRPLVSVIINVFNGERYLAEAIESVFAQTHRPFELIVVDDGSEDDTAAVAKRFEPELRYVHQPNQGIGAARNHGVGLARGEYLAFLDADDRFVPDKLERQLRAFAEDPGLEMAFGHVREFISPDLPEEIASRLRAPVEDVPWRMTNLMLVKRASYDRAGPFSTELKVGVGVDWYAHAVEAGLKETVVPAVVLERRLHAANNGILQRDARPQYLSVLKAAMDRRRAQAAEADTEPDAP